jgi:hypothetical protein
LAISEYILAIKREVNPRLGCKRYTIHFLAALSKVVGIERSLLI